MHVKKKIRQVYNPMTRRWEAFPYPTSIEEARAEGCAKYHDLNARCDYHGMQPIVFVQTDIYQCCAMAESLEFYDEAVKKGEPLTVGEAHRFKKDYYWRPKFGEYCGHPGKRTLNHKCWYCEQKRSESPRSIAKAAGEMWYQPLPGDLCDKGHNAPRRVSTGSCQQCEAEARVRVTPFYMDPANAEMIISREEARTLGLPAYRTGNPCGAGHKGFRYTTTGGCISCLRRR